MALHSQGSLKMALKVDKHAHTLSQHHRDKKHLFLTHTLNRVIIKGALSNLNLRFLAREPGPLQD
jgi:hypothetical protein